MNQIRIPHVTVLLWISIVCAAIFAMLITIPIVVLIIVRVISWGFPDVKYDPSQGWWGLLVLAVPTALLIYCILREPGVLRRSPGPLAFILNVWLVSVSLFFFAYCFVVLKFFP